jgi:hypothetical protein
MSREPQRTSVLLDWFNVSYRSVVAGLAVLVVIAGLAGWYFLFVRPAGPKLEAQDAIARATERLAEAAGYPSEGRLDEVRASARAALDEARGLLARSQYDDSRVSAIRSENLSQKAIDMARGERTTAGEVRILKLDGDVRVKKAGEFAWDRLDRGTVLRVGDQIKTAASASVEIIYFDGTVTRVQPGSLLEIRRLREDPATRVREVSEKLNWGEVVASTRKKNVEGSYHEVATERVSARTDEEGQFRVAVDQTAKTAAFDVFQGKVRVAAPDRTEDVTAGERMRAGADGQLMAKEVLPGVPRLIAPSDERVFVYEAPSNESTTLNWEKVPGAARYHLLISGKPLFASTLYDGERVETSVVWEAVPEGEYYWKVAAISGSGVRGPYSEPRRFRVTTQRIRDREDTTPPTLKIDPPIQTGPMLIINGRTEPGASLWVDNEKVDVYDDGTFYAVIRLRKEGANDVTIVAQDAAGNSAKHVHRAYVESY